MQMLLKRFKKEEKGFTLIELLAVIVILAVIAVIAVPLIGNIIGKSKEDSDLATARQVYEAARLYNVSENSGVMKDVTVGVLQTSKYLETPVYLPSNKEALDSTASKVEFTATGELKSVIIKSTNGTAKTYNSTEVLASTKATPTPTT